MKVFNIPIEPLEERYTKQMDVWVKEAFIKNKLNVVTIYGNQLTTKVESGSVLDAEGTNYYKFSQLMQICELFKKGEVKNGDIFFIGDLWFPGLEAIKYISALEKINIKIYGVVWAGSFDHADFVYDAGMEPWAQHIERGWFDLVDGLFVGAQNIKDDIVKRHRIKDPSKIHITGGPWDTKSVQDRVIKKEKEKIVIFPHRFDYEKRPDKFLKLAEIICKERNDVKFLITTSRHNIRSSRPWLVKMYYDTKKKLGDKIDFKYGITKDQYYQYLSDSRIFWSSAEQETFGYATLEALALNTTPVVPNKLSYIDYIPKKYRYNTFEEGVNLVRKYLDKDESISKIANKYDCALDKMVKIMLKR